MVLQILTFHYHRILKFTMHNLKALYVINWLKNKL